jgi:glycosyltransferase 2 family protein
MSESTAGSAPGADTGTADTPPPADRRPLLRRRAVVALEVVLLAAAVVAGVLAVVAERDALGQAWSDIGAGRVVAAGALGLVGVRASAQVWLAAMAAADVRVPARTGVPLFAVTQLGKYLPGAAWPYLAQLHRLRQHGARTTDVLTGQAVFLLLHVGTGALVAVAALPALGGTGLMGGWWLYLLPALAGLLLLWPPVLRALLRHAPGRLRRETLLHGRDLARAGAWMGLTWLSYGAALALLSRPLSELSPATLLTATGCFALAWTVGFVVVVTPAGAGVREVVLVAALSATGMEGVTALAVALASRVSLTLADLALPAVSAATARRAGPVPGGPR